MRLCILINDLDFFNLPGADPLQNDGTYAASALLRRLIGLEWVESVEIYLPSHLLVKQSEFSNAIRAFLPRERRGKGTLNVYPVHSLPDVWTDRVPRAILSVSPECMPRDRYLRDRFACGPAVVLAMAFTLGEHRAWASLRILADSLPTKFDSIVSPTAALLEAYHKAFVGFLSPDGNIPCRLDLLAQPVDTEKFAPADSAIRARARLNLNLPLDAVVTLFLGRLTAHDKADLIPLIRCFAQTSTSADEYLLIVGTESSSSFAARLREFGDSLGLADRLIIRTNISAEMRSEYYAASDIFVFTCDGIQEACTVTVVEAMASGLPVIVSDWAGLGCLVVNGETGYCIPTFWLPGQERVEAMSPASLHRLDCLFLAQSIWGDTEVLSERLRRLLASPPLRRQLGAAGRARALQEFSWDAMLPRLRTTLDEMFAAAEAEAPADRAERIGEGDAMGMPTPYRELFNHYATEVLEPAAVDVQLTEAGKAMLRQTSALFLYDDTVPILDQATMDSLLRKLAPGDWVNLAQIAVEVADETSVLEDRVLFHTTLLIKHEILVMRRVVVQPG